MLTKSILVSLLGLAVIAQASKLPKLTYRQFGDGNGTNDAAKGGNNNNGDATVLAADAIQTGSAQDGQSGAGVAAGQSPSKT